MTSLFSERQSWGFPNWRKAAKSTTALEEVQKAMEELDKHSSVLLFEPCDCASEIRHNDGGNYHQIILVEKTMSKYILHWRTTQRGDGWTEDRWVRMDRAETEEELRYSFDSWLQKEPDEDWIEEAKNWPVEYEEEN